MVNMHKHVNYISLGEKTVGIKIKHAMKVKVMGELQLRVAMVRNACLMMCSWNGNLNAMQVPASRADNCGKAGHSAW